MEAVVSTYCPDTSVDAACSLMTPHTDALNYGRMSRARQGWEKVVYQGQYEAHFPFKEAQADKESVIGLITELFRRGCQLGWMESGGGVVWSETHVFYVLCELCILPEEVRLCGGQGGPLVRVEVKDGHVWNSTRDTWLLQPESHRGRSCDPPGGAEPSQAGPCCCLPTATEPTSKTHLQKLFVIESPMCLAYKPVSIFVSRTPWTRQTAP